MFTSISWQIYFTAILLIVSGYYGIATVILYHHEIVQWFKSLTKNCFGTGLEKSPEEVRSSPVMGSVNIRESDRLPRTSTIEPGEINVISSDDEVEIIQTATTIHNDELLVGSIADLIEDIKSLVQVVIANKSDRTETQSLFHTLLMKYPHLLETSYRRALSFYIVESANSHFTFQLSVDDVMKWWLYESISMK